MLGWPHIFKKIVVESKIHEGSAGIVRLTSGLREARTVAKLYDVVVWIADERLVHGTSQ